MTGRRSDFAALFHCACLLRAKRKKRDVRAPASHYSPPMNTSVEDRISRLDWAGIGASLDTAGAAVTGPLLTGAECDAISALYANDEAFRSRIVISRHGFGSGEYKYFAYPLRPVIAALRKAVYPRLVPVANRWHEQMGIDVRFPDKLDAFLKRCHEADRQRATPLLLRYREGDYNCLHQDLYGEHVFPLQLAILLSEPGKDFEGGEFVLTEQRPRTQSRAEVICLKKGEGVIFAVRHRPKQGTRGTYRVMLRHGISTIRRGERYTTGIIFHDAA
jgi:hypothetical protein